MTGPTDFDNPDTTSSTGAPPEKWVNPLLGLAKDSKLTVERFMEMQREDIELENELDKRRAVNSPSCSRHNLISPRM